MTTLRFGSLTSRHSSRKGLALLLLCLATVSCPAESARDFDVPSGEAVQTLRVAARQAGLQIAVDAGLVRDLRTPQVRGSFTATEAFSRMLAARGLEAVVDEASQTVSIRRRPEEKVRDGETTPVPRPSPKHVAAPGVLRGRVTDLFAHSALAGARIRLVDLDLAVYADRFGYYQFDGIPAGEHSLIVTYDGAESTQTTVQLTAGAGLVQDVELVCSSFMLDAHYVNAQATGSARALNEQRAADTLVNVVAADAIGRFPDQNAAESLQRVPGVALYRDQGEGRFVIIRGINAMYNRVMLNGSPMATPEAGSRNAPLDVIGSDSLGSAEVQKVPTPDKDAEGLGGSIDLRMKSAFDYEEPQAELGLATTYSRLVHGSGYKLNASASQFLFDEKIGVMVSVSSQRRPFGSQNYEEGDGWSEVISPTDGRPHWVFNQVAFRDYEIIRTRDSINAAVDYRPTDLSSVQFRASYARFIDTEKRWLTLIPFTSKGKVTALTDTGASFTGVTGVSKRLRLREKQQTLGDTSLGFQHRPADWVIDGLLNYSKAWERKPNELEARFDTKAANNLNYSFEDPYHLSANVTGGVDINAPASFSSIKGSLKQAAGDELLKGARLNVLRNLDTPWGKSSLKTGLSVLSKDKSMDKDSSDYVSGPSGYTFPALAETAGDYPYFQGPRVSADKLGSLFSDSRSAFVFKLKDADSLISDFASTERVTGGYVMGTTQFHDLRVIGGLRAEQTRFSTTGWQQRGSVFSRASASSSRTDLLPGIILRQDLGRSLVLRASWTNSLARPAFEQTAISRVITDDSSSPKVTQGNPALKPLRSRNWDLSAEYYLSTLGSVSVSAFRKEISDFSFLAQSGTDASTGYPLSTYINGPTGTIDGVELAYQQGLRFLPGPLKGLGIFANATFSDSSAEYPTRPGERLPFIGQSRQIYNAGLSYEYRGLFVRLAANYRSPRLREDEVLGESVSDDRYVDRFLQWDLTVKYRLGKSVEFYGEFVNLTNEPFRVYFGGSGPKRLVQLEEYGLSSNIGIRWKL